jgi:predicted transcriptional regulator
MTAMAQTNEQKYLAILEQIKRLIIPSLSQQGVEGKRIAQVMGVDAAAISRVLSPSPKKGKK